MISGKYSRTGVIFPPLLLLLALTTIASFLCLWVCDDAYISFRYARNFAHGLGLRYNVAAHPPVEGYSNLLWVLLAAFFEFVNFPPDSIIPLISVVCGLVLAIRVYRFLIQHCSCSPYLACLLTATMTFAPSFLIWSSSGLAPMPFSLLIFLCFERFIVSEKQLYFFGTAALLTATYLIRAEAFAWLGCIIALALLFSPQKKHVLRVAIPTLFTILCVHLTWRYSYYGSFLPNTANAKVGFSIARLERGLHYILVYSLTCLVPLVAVFALLRLPLLLRKPSLLTACTLFIGFYAYSVLVGGDYMSMGRFLVPALPFQAIAFAILVHNWNQVYAYGLTSSLLVLGLLPIFNLHIVSESLRAAFHFRHNRSVYVSEYEHWQFMRENSARWRKKGELLAQYTKPSESIVEGAIGNVGYFSHLEIFDRMGLVSRIPKAKNNTILRSPGHDIRVPAEYFLDKKPTYLWYKKMGPKGLKNLLKHESNTPNSYAPVVHVLDTKVRNRFVVLLKYFDKQAERDAAWALLSNYSK